MHKRFLTALALGASVGLAGCQGAAAPVTVTQTVTVPGSPSTITPGASGATTSPGATASRTPSARPGSAAPTSTVALGPVSDPQVVTIQEMMKLKAGSGVGYYTYSNNHPQAPNGGCDVIPSIPGNAVEIYATYTKPGAPALPPRIGILMTSLGSPAAAHDTYGTLDARFASCSAASGKSGTDIKVTVPSAEEARASRFDVTVGNTKGVEYVAAIRVADRLETLDLFLPSALADESAALSELLEKAASKLATK